MNTFLAALAVVLTAAAFAFGVYTHGYRSGQADAFAQVEAAQNAQRQALSKAEAARLQIQSERDRLAQELEDQANAAPVAYPACLDPDRVRRLNALR